jgi:hypothetical protein
MNAFSGLVVILGVALLSLLALLGDRQFAIQDRIPIRWGRAERPNLYISRRLGLCVFPVVGTVLMLALALHGLPTFVVASAQLALAAANLLYFHAIGRALQDM